jgi:plastocyanin
MHDNRHSIVNPGGFPLWFICLGLGCLLAESALAQPLSVEVRTPDGAAVAGVAIYLEALDREMPPGSNEVAIEIQQLDKGFAPYVSVVQAGSTVTFSNYDDITHHIYSVTGNERFAFSLRAGEITSGMTIEQVGLIAMGCNIHDWMSGYLLVVDSPYYGTTDPQGRVVVDVEQAGSYRVVTWHPQVAKSAQKIVQLPGRETLSLRLEQALPDIPRQKGIDNFDFLEGY